MTARIPILFDWALWPEWVDYTLDQYVQATDERSL